MCGSGPAVVLSYCPFQSLLDGFASLIASAAG